MAQQQGIARAAAGRFRETVSLLVLLTGLLGGWGLAAAGDSGNAEPVDAAARKQLKAVLGRENLRLSTRPGSAAEKFFFVCRVEMPAQESDAPAKTFTLFVQRYGEQAGMASFDERVPWKVVNSQMMAAPDPSARGLRVLAPGGTPKFLLVPEAERMKFIFRWQDGQGPPVIDCDLDGLIQNALAKSEKITRSPGPRPVYRIQTVGPTAGGRGVGDARQTRSGGPGAGGPAAQPLR